MSECCCCGGGLRRLVGRKLGRCLFCIRMTAALAAVACGLAIAATGMLQAPLVVGAAWAVAVVFSLMLGAHVVAYLRNVRRAAPAVTLPSSGTMGRREFLRMTLGASLTALASAVLGLTPMPALAQGKCSWNKQKQQCQPQICDTGYDSSGNKVTLNCFNPPRTQDCICSTGTQCADANGNCDKSLCPDYWKDQARRKPFTKECVKASNNVCYCKYS